MHSCVFHIMYLLPFWSMHIILEDGFVEYTEVASNSLFVNDDVLIVEIECNLTFHID